MNYLFVYLPTDNLDPETVNAYRIAVEQELIDRWPDAEVDVTSYSNELVVDTDRTDVEIGVVRAIAEQLWPRDETD